MVQTSSPVSLEDIAHAWESHTKGAVLPVPYPDGLVVTGTNDPGELVVEENGSNVIQVPIQREQTPPGLQGPDLDLVVVTPRNEEGL